MNLPFVMLVALSVLAVDASGAASLDVSAWPVEKAESGSGPTTSDDPAALSGALDWTDPGLWR
jgi:hypothetical protein